MGAGAEDRFQQDAEVRLPVSAFGGKPMTAPDPLRRFGRSGVRLDANVVVRLGFDLKALAS